MNTTEEKLELINKITKLQEPRLIQEINELIDFELEEGLFKITPKQKSRILEAKEEYKKGNILSEKEANQKTQEWLMK